MGADNAFHICDQAFDGAGPLDLAKALAEAAKKIGYDLILAGQSAVDGGFAFVGAAVAEYLGIPSVTFLVKIDGGPELFVLRRESDDGIQEVSCALPALWTCQKGLNEVRYPTLPGIMKAKKKEITVWTAADLGLSPAPLKVAKLELPPERKPGRMIPGEGKEAARELVRLLKEEAKVL
jgi:electron transfer flavoprotein beta subunit